MNVDHSVGITWALSNASRDILLPEVLYFHLEVNPKAGSLSDAAISSPQV